MGARRDTGTPASLPLAVPRALRPSVAAHNASRLGYLGALQSRIYVLQRLSFHLPRAEIGERRQDGRDAGLPRVFVGQPAGCDLGCLANRDQTRTHTNSEWLSSLSTLLELSSHLIASSSSLPPPRWRLQQCSSLWPSSSSSSLTLARPSCSPPALSRCWFP